MEYDHLKSSGEPSLSAVAQSAHISGNRYNRKLTSLILALMLVTNIVFRISAEAETTNRTLHLTPEQNHYFLGPYLYYLEDLDKVLTIDDVSAPQISARYVKHTNKMLNLGLNSCQFIEVVTAKKFLKALTVWDIVLITTAVLNNAPHWNREVLIFIIHDLAPIACRVSLKVIDYYPLCL